MVWSCTAPETSASKSATVRRLSSQRTRSFASPLSCICGSDLWPYRGIGETDGPTPMGHEYVGIVEEVGDAVSTIKPGQFVVGSFFASDNTCEICQAGYQTHCVQRQAAAATGAQSEFVRIALADGTLVATPGEPDPELIPSLLAASDVLGTGWFAAVAAQAGPEDGRGGRGRGRWPTGGARSQATRRRADYRDESPPSPAEAGPRVRRHRHR